MAELAKTLTHFTVTRQVDIMNSMLVTADLGFPIGGRVSRGGHPLLGATTLFGAQALFSENVNQNEIDSPIGKTC